MSSGHTLLTIGAFLLLMTTLINFYNLVGAVGDDIGTGQDDILATAVATSWGEMAQGLAFDNVTDSSDIAFRNTTVLTPALDLGVEAGESSDSVATYNDFDDFAGAVLAKHAGASGKIFTTRFSVNYVDTANVNTTVASRTFIKRLDMRTWRSQPPPRANEQIDTLQTSIIYSYFNFN